MSVRLINDGRIDGRADLSLQVVGPTNQVLWKKKRGVALPKPGRELWTGTIAASGSAGHHRFVVRLLRGVERLAESSVSFFVYDAVPPSSVTINVLDPEGAYSDAVAKAAPLGNIRAPIHIVPPLANSIRAYPDNELAQILGQVREGAVALLFEPPGDWNDFAQQIDPGITAETVRLPSAGVLPFARLHPIFDGLPAGGILGETYRHVLTNRAFAEQAEELAAGVLWREDSGPGAQAAVYPTILVRRYGSGRIVFVHYAVLHALAFDPVARRLLVNLLEHFVRRAVPTGGTLPVHQRSVEWLRQEKTRAMRKWMLIGPFGGGGDDGRGTEFPPENEREFDEVYAGWYALLRWKPYYTTEATDHELDFREALLREALGEAQPVPGTAYAWAELAADARMPGEIEFDSDTDAILWFNGRKMHPGDMTVNVRQGRNTILVKISGDLSRARFRFDVKAEQPLKWLR